MIRLMLWYVISVPLTNISFLKNCENEELSKKIDCLFLFSQQSLCIVGTNIPPYLFAHTFNSPPLIYFLHFLRKYHVDIRDRLCRSPSYGGDRHRVAAAARRGEVEQCSSFGDGQQTGLVERALPRRDHGGVTAAGDERQNMADSSLLCSHWRGTARRYGVACGAGQQQERRRRCCHRGINKCCFVFSEISI